MICTIQLGLSISLCLPLVKTSVDVIKADAIKEKEKVKESTYGNEACATNSKLVVDHVRSAAPCCRSCFKEKAVSFHCREQVVYLTLKENQWH